MAEYHVGCGLAGIYAGTIQKPGMWRNKSCVTDEAVEAVRDYLIDERLGGLGCSKSSTGGYEWALKDGRTVQLMVTIKPVIPQEGGAE